MFDPVFPVEGLNDFMCVHRLTYTPLSTDVDTDPNTGRWEYAKGTPVAFDGYAAGPDRAAIDQGAAKGVVISAVVRCPHTVGVTEKAIITIGPDSGANGWLLGEYTIEIVRPNAADVRVLLSRLEGDRPAHVPT